MLGLRSGSIGLLSLLLLACTRRRQPLIKLSQLPKSSLQLETSKGLSDINAIAEARALYAHLQNIKQQHM